MPIRTNMDDEKILNILRSQRHTFTPAEFLAQRLSISKAVLARHIHKLREEGYDIQVQPHRGYKLAALPDKLLAEELKWQLKTRLIGQKIFSYNIVDSTNMLAFTLARQGAQEGSVVFAEGQTQGRGRLGRRWFSPPQTGIYLSLILRPDIHPQQAAFITLLGAVSCCEAVREAWGLPAQIRWPNDILVNNRKVCGILTEMQTEGAKVKFVILGIGINVNTPVDKLPSGASSLSEEAKGNTVDVSRLELARILLRRLDQDYLSFQQKGSRDFVARWNNLSSLSGKRVKVFFEHTVVEGQAQDIDEQGALIIRLDSGFKQHVVAGDVVKVR